MTMNNTKKLCLYCLDCVKATGRASGFNNLKKNKENKVIITNSTEFDADNKAIIEMMTKQALNKSVMGIYAGYLMLQGVKGKEQFYSPLLYCEAELKRDNDGKIKLQYDENDLSVNVGLISSLLENDSDIIENTINQLLDIDEPCRIDFKKVLSGLINLDGFEIKEEKAIILTRTPESVAGLINELKQISEYYC